MNRRRGTRILHRSRRCRCPEPGTELRVETPSGTIVDLGTEFAVTVEPDVRTRVAVIEGQVRVDGREASRLMSAGDAVSIDREGRSSDDIGFLKDVATRGSKNLEGSFFLRFSSNCYSSFSS